MLLKGLAEVRRGYRVYDMHIGIEAKLLRPGPKICNDILRIVLPVFPEHPCSIAKTLPKLLNAQLSVRTLDFHCESLK